MFAHHFGQCEETGRQAGALISLPESSNAHLSSSRQMHRVASVGIVSFTRGFADKDAAAAPRQKYFQSH